MTKHFFKEKVLDPGPSVNPFVAMAEAGMMPAQIKAFIVEVLQPYFSNLDRLEQLAVDVLAPQSINLVRLQGNTWAMNAFEHVWGLYRCASAIDPKAAYQVCADSEPAITDSLAEYWSALYLEEQKVTLDLHDFKYEVLRNIGALVEANIQPLLRDILTQVRIKRGKNPDFADVKRLKLGSVVEELIQTAGIPDLFAPSPWGIRLNQWRNIAQHHRSRVHGAHILGVFGEPPNESEVVFSREELLAALHCLYSVFQVLSLARTLFFIDHLDDIKPLLPETEIRSDVRMMSFTTGVSTQGFQVVDLAMDETTAHATLRDLRETTKERLVHASQLLIPLWRNSRSKSVELRYTTSAGEHKMTFSTLGEACRRLDAEEISVEEYLEFVTFEPVLDE
jgi:hypothetical protein